MSQRPYSKVLNFAWYQLTWFTAVLGGSAYEGLLAILMLMHLGMVAAWRQELALMIAVAAVGCTVDGVLAMAGYFRFAEPGWLPIPLWHVAIWLGFAGTLRHSMAFMVARPRLLSLAAALFAPLTYLAAQRFGAVQFPLGNLPTAIAISLCWLAITPLLLWLTAIANDAMAAPRVSQALSVTVKEQ